jgi:hypothetical protein
LSLFLCVAGGAHASTVAPPSDLGHLARLSDAVVLARAESSWTEAAGPDALPWTATRFARLTQVSGTALPDVFVVAEPGGASATRGVAIGGAPDFRTGRTYLLFLAQGTAGRWRARMLSYGLLVEDAERGLLVPMDESAALELAPFAAFEPVGAYERDALLGHLADVAQGAAWNRHLAGWRPSEGLVPPPAQCGFLTDTTDGLRIRWFGYEAGGTQSQIRHTMPGQAGIPDGGVSAVTQSVAAWTDHADSIIRYAYAGSAPRQLNCTQGAELGAVWFNDPCADIPDLTGCAGTLAFGGVSYSIVPQLHDGDLWHPVQAPYVVINNGAQCVGDVTFREVMAHELGHTQGFGHHAPTPPPNPTMSAFVKGDGRGAALVGVDRSCASYAYHTFLDVPFHDAAWRFVEAVDNVGVPGCAPGSYCPTAAITREQMAIFLIKAKLGPGYVPALCTTAPFNDVPANSPYCPWIRELVARQVTAGCGNGNYCPTAPVTREQMAVFLLRTRETPAYLPPACTAPMFNDVPCASGFARWVNELVRRGITAGCGGGNYCPTQPNTRAQMAVFVSTTFALPLPN